MNHSLYGLKQATRAWYNRFASNLASIGLVGAKLDTSLFIYRCSNDIVYLLLYVDGIVLMASITTFYSTRSSPFNGSLQ
jgi:hypothetical protein